MSRYDHFVPIDPASFDFSRYAALVGARMNPVDYTPPDELRAMIENKTLSAWIMSEADKEWLGWCAVRWDHNKYHDPAHHIWGIVTFDEKRSGSGLLGLGFQATRFLIEQAGSHPLTASIRPENRASLMIARRCGFQELGAHGPWINYIYS